MSEVLNWREIAHLVDLVKPELEGLHVERIQVPERPEFPEGYLKGEWLLRLTGRRKELGLVISARARHPYFLLHEERKIPRSSATATRSAFDLGLAKHLKGAKLDRIEAIRRERTVVLWFAGEKKLGLVLTLIPTAPEALLVSAEGAPAAGPWPILARSRAKENDAKSLGTFTPPDGAKAPEGLPLREQLVGSMPSWIAIIEKGLRAEAFELKVRQTERELRERLKHAKEQVRSSNAALQEARTEPEWQRYGDLLKTSLGYPPPIIDGEREVEDYETGKKVRIPCDPKLTPKDQVEKFYRFEKRKKKRREEAESRISLFGESAAKLEKALEALGQLSSQVADLEALEKLRAGAGLGGPKAPVAREKGRAAHGGWQGKIFTSRDGYSIWVGRNRTENLELTFKHARGNDLWTHVRGRPGAHVVVPIPSGKSAPLETLLDAAVLTVYYSGGEKWGKTEVDYTYKKHVKRIKDSTEASYTHNKTLIVEPDAVRLKRLLEGQSEAGSR